VDKPWLEARDPVETEEVVPLRMWAPTATMMIVAKEAREEMGQAAMMMLVSDRMESMAELEEVELELATELTEKLVATATQPGLPVVAEVQTSTEMGQATKNELQEQAAPACLLEATALMLLMALIAAYERTPKQEKVQLVVTEGRSTKRELTASLQAVEALLVEVEEVARNQIGVG